MFTCVFLLRQKLYNWSLIFIRYNILKTTIKIISWDSQVDEHLNKHRENNLGKANQILYKNIINLFLMEHVFDITYLWKNPNYSSS